MSILGVGCGHGAKDPRCGYGPHALQRLMRQEYPEWPVHWQGVLEPVEPNAGPLDAVVQTCSRLAAETAKLVSAGMPFAVVGGDHSCAVGTWSGAARAMRAQGPLGLIWIDAHMDSHVPETSPSGALHGMPLACLLGYGPYALRSLAGPGPALKPQHVVLVGIRSFEPEEADLLKRLGVRVIFAEEVRRIGLAQALQEAMARIGGETAGFGVSVDLDAIDPDLAPGVGSPVPGGLDDAELVAQLRQIASAPGFLGLEVAELNPYRDRNWMTARLTLELVRAATPRVQRRFAMKDASVLEDRYCAHNYDPLPVTLVKGEGVYVWDHEGRRYLDMMSAYSAVSLGHCHPRILQTLKDQAGRLAVVSRAYYTDQLGPFARAACELTGQEVALPMNTGAEAVETALKAARKWAYTVKGVPAEQAEIIACHGNFHGRTIAIVGMSSEIRYRDGFGPFPPGFRLIPYGDIDALEQAISPHTAAFLVEPIQGEGGLIFPPAGYLRECARICRKHNVLLICDEVQTGLGRTGRLLASQHEDVMPDGLILGKALGGGVLPVSLFLARRDVMDVFQPGDHGSTFGGNPLACAVGLTVLNVLKDEQLAERSAELGDYFLRRLRTINNPVIQEVRGKGLFTGLEVRMDMTSARAVCDRLLAHGILSKDTHESVVRFAPPLTITREQIDWAVPRIAVALDEARRYSPDAA